MKKKTSKAGKFEDGLFAIEVAEKNGKFAAWLHSLRTEVIKVKSKKGRIAIHMLEQLHDLTACMNGYFAKQKVIDGRIKKTCCERCKMLLAKGKKGGEGDGNAEMSSLQKRR